MVWLVCIAQEEGSPVLRGGNPPVSANVGFVRFDLRLRLRLRRGRSSEKVPIDDLEDDLRLFA